MGLRLQWRRLLKYLLATPQRTIFASYALFVAYSFLSFNFACLIYPYIELSDIYWDILSSQASNKTSSTWEKQCKINIADKPVNIQEQITWSELPERVTSPGGRWRPKHCNSIYRVAIILPYRNRPAHLGKFLSYIHNFLQSQSIEYGIFVVEQSDRLSFNRAKLFNVGFKEAQKVNNYHCLIFHDIDLIPENLGNIYACSTQPRHMSVAINTFRYNLMYEGLFGGAVAMTKKQFVSVNGFSNSYWGWGGEDDDLQNRIRNAGMHVVRWDPIVSRYKMLLHIKEPPSEDRLDLLNSGRQRFGTDGLNSLNYKVLNVSLLEKCTLIHVDLTPS